MKAVFNIGYTLANPPSSYTGERRADYIAERNFYNLTADYNYFTYTLSVECSCISDILEIYKNLLRQKKVYMAPTFYHLEIGKNRVEIIIDFITKTDLLPYKGIFKYINKQLIKVE